jgi:hypothetical protein
VHGAIVSSQADRRLGHEIPAASGLAQALPLLDAGAVDGGSEGVVGVDAPADGGVANECEPAVVDVVQPAAPMTSSAARRADGRRQARTATTSPTRLMRL